MKTAEGQFAPSLRPWVGGPDRAWPVGGRVWDRAFRQHQLPSGNAADRLSSRGVNHRAPPSHNRPAGSHIRLGRDRRGCPEKSSDDDDGAAASTVSVPVKVALLSRRCLGVDGPHGMPPRTPAPNVSAAPPPLPDGESALAAGSHPPARRPEFVSFCFERRTAKRGP